MEPTYTKVSNDDELQQILALQADNLRHRNNLEIENEQGFVTLKHDFELLKLMNNVTPHIIAKDNDRVVGYILAMPKTYRNFNSSLDLMFDFLDTMTYNNQSFIDLNYLVMGQICIDKNYRGKGIFKGLYSYYFKYYLPTFACIVTEVASRNKRSLNAHLNIGFEVIHIYDEPGVEEWVVLLHN